MATSFLHQKVFNFCVILQQRTFDKPLQRTSRRTMRSAQEIKWICIIMSFLSFLFGCGKGESEKSKPPEARQIVAASSEDSVPEPAYGTILVRNGTSELVRDAIESHAGLDEKEVPQYFRVTIAEDSNGNVVVRFPDGAPPYNIVNLIGWLNDPPEITGVSDAMGWITSPSTGLRYSLIPEVGNQWGDTLVGASSDGTSVRVYLPEAALCEISRVVSAYPEPDPESQAGAPQLTFNVAMDVAPDFGNHEFRITHPKDTTWSP